MSRATTVSLADLQPRAVNPWIVAVIVSMATFMEVLDTSIANVSLRHIAGSLAAGLDESTWVLTSYLIANAIVMPISGWLATTIGRKRFYMICVLLFTISSLLCGMAPSLGWLVFCRVLQGVGGGGLAPSEQAILTDTFPAHKRGQAFALYGIAVVVAPAIGPTLGGWITDNYDWRWIFFINVPVGVLSLFLTYWFVPDLDAKHAVEDARRRKSGIDYLGFGLVALSLGSLQVVLDRGQIEDWFGSPLIVGLVIVMVVSTVLFVLQEFTVKDPIVDLPLYRNVSFLMSNIAMFSVGFILFGTTQLIPQMLQELMGYTATRAGMALSPGAVLVFFCMPLVGFLVGRVQPKYLVMFGLLSMAAAMYYMTRFDTQIDFATAASGRMIQSFGLAFMFVPINTVAYSGLPKSKSNNASALINLMRNLGGSVGISFVQTMLARRSQFHQARLIDRISTFNPYFVSRHAPLARVARAVQQQAGMLSYIDVFYVMAICALTAILAAVFLKHIKLGGGPAGH